MSAPIDRDGYHLPRPSDAALGVCEIIDALLHRIARCDASKLSRQEALVLSLLQVQVREARADLWPENHPPLYILKEEVTDG